jgi:hypothetical protein
VRWLLVAVVATFSSLGAYASEPAAGEATSIVEASSGADAGVTVTPIPMPEPVTQLLQPVNPVAKLRSAKKPKLAKKESFPKSMLSRTERHQMALLLPSSSATGQPSRKHLHDEHGEAGYDELALHSFFNRPKVVSEPADSEDADASDLSEAIKLRLFLARAKAVQAHTLAKVADDLDDKLSEAVKLRLLLARTKAVQAHQKKFS